MYWCSVTAKIAVLVTIGLGLALTAIISYLFLPYIVEYNVKQNLVLSPNSMTFKGWKSTSIDIFTQFYIFNVTNANEFLSQTQKPILQQLGPFTFKESIDKTNIRWNHSEGTVSYKQIRRWVFVPEMTTGSLDDEVIHLNVPMISAGESVKYEQFKLDAINAFVEDSKSLIFKRNTVRELLFDGYDEILLELAKELFPLTPFTRFGWFYSRNNTQTEESFSIYTGEKAINRLGLLKSWNNSDINNKWFGKQCERIEGISAGDFQPPFRTPVPKSVDIFIGDLCRAFTLEFSHEVDFKGIKTNRYSANPSLFDYSLPENQCYCPSNGCPANGVLNVSTCTKGSPTAISYPHFLYADQKYLDSVGGLTPSALTHSFYMDIENSLGIPLNIAVRLQINTVFEGNENLEFSRNMTQKQIYFPQFWFSTTAQINDDLVEKLDFLLNRVPFYTNVMTIVFLFVGFLALICAVFYAFRDKKKIHLNRRQKYKAVEMNTRNHTIN